MQTSPLKENSALRLPHLSARRAWVAAGFLIVLLLAGCTSVAPTPAAPTPAEAAVAPATAAPEPSPTVKATQTEEVAPTDAPTLTPTALPPTEPPPTATATSAPPSPTLAPTTEPTSPPASPAARPSTAEPRPPSGPGIVIDHRAVDDFDRIPDEYIQKATQLRQLARGASVIDNINNGLNCLANNFDGRRPNFCDRGLSPDQVVSDPKYNRDNWTIEFHAPPPGLNPPWGTKLTAFVDRINGFGANVPFDVASYTIDYVELQDGGNIDDIYFKNDPNDRHPSIEDIAALEAAHPDLTIVYWTSNLARSIGSPDSQSFNQQMRAYAAEHGKVLFDMADIESHAPDGSPCVDNGGRNLPAICAEYTNEINAGHLNSVGSQRVAKAMWVLMARLAGWSG